MAALLSQLPSEQLIPESQELSVVWSAKFWGIQHRYGLTLSDEGPISSRVLSRPVSFQFKGDGWLRLNVRLRPSVTLQLHVMSTTRP